MKIKLSNLNLTQFPWDFINQKCNGDLSQVTKLFLSSNRLTEIPKEIGSLSNLQELWLDNNKITEIPKEIGSLYNLQELYLWGNQITEIPSIEVLQKQWKLHIAVCRLETYWICHKLCKQRKLINESVILYHLRPGGLLALQAEYDFAHLINQN